MITHINCDILDFPADIVAHQVNCMGKFNAGLAKQIKSKYPEAARVYFDFVRDTPKNKRDRLLGRCCIAWLDGEACGTNDDKMIAHLFGQYDYGTDKCYTNYVALEEALVNLKNFATMFNYSIAIPYGIGCGLGGGNWDEVDAIITKVFADFEGEVYICQKM